MHPVLGALKDRLMAQPEGVAVAAAVSRHFSEVRRLINTNRRVATVWHRAAGPCLLRELLGRATHPGGSAALLGGPNREYLERWWDLLARFGSPRLKAGLERYRSVVMDLLRAHMAPGLETAPAECADATPGLEALAGP
jgi:hypothetical protein